MIESAYLSEARLHLQAHLTEALGRAQSQRLVEALEQFIDAKISALMEAR